MIKFGTSAIAGRLSVPSSEKGLCILCRVKARGFVIFPSGLFLLVKSGNFSAFRGRITHRVNAFHIKPSWQMAVKRGEGRHNAS